MDNAAKKKQMKKIRSWVALALTVVILTAMPLMAKSEAEADGPVASILSGTVEKGNISTGLHGGGNLKMENAEDIKLPSGVKITEFLVKNGDTVKEGDPVAAVDTVSVMTAIMEVRDTMDYLQEQIADVRNETVSSAVKAVAGGRIKEIYAQEGDSVQSVMLEHGCLALLSLDGLMAVELKSDLPLSTGDSVSVVLADEKTVEGRVESSLDGVIIVTVEDEGYDIGQAAAVTTPEGETVGAGSLYVHNAWKATAFTGTISRVHVKDEKTVRSGTRLFTLKDTDFTAQMEYLSDRHREYEVQLQELFQMYESGVITAPRNGVISGVDEDSTFLLSGEKVDWEAVPLADSQDKGWTILLLSSEGGAEEPGTGESQPPAPSDPSTPSTPGTGEIVTYTGYAGRVSYIGSTEVILTMSQVGGTVTKTAEGAWDLSQVNLDTANMLTPNCIFTVGDASAYAVGDIVVVAYDEAGQYTVIMAQKANPDPEPSIPGMPGGYPGGMGGLGSLAGLFGGMSGMAGLYGSGAAAVPEEPELYDLEGDVLMTVTPQDVVSLVITIDEQDISKVSVGQGAQVKVEALRGQLFEAEVVQVGTSGTNNGGSSKFTVKLELPYCENMLDGMSAAAEIPLYTRMEVPTIPVEALAEVGARTVVYTALDKETGEPSQPVEVTLGMSDGRRAEILSGLSMGDTYYYSYYDIMELDTSVNTQKYTFG